MPDKDGWAGVPVIAKNYDYLEGVEKIAVLVWNSGSWSKMLQPATNANAETSHGKSPTFINVNQTVAGTTELAAAVNAKKHKILGCVLTTSLAGTVKFADSSDDLLGPMDLLASQPFVLPTSVIPYQQTGATNRALNLVSTLGAVRGAVVILTEP